MSCPWPCSDEGACSTCSSSKLSIGSLHAARLTKKDFAHTRMVCADTPTSSAIPIFHLLCTEWKTLSAYARCISEAIVRATYPSIHSIPLWYSSGWSLTMLHREWVGYSLGAHLDVLPFIESPLGVKSLTVSAAICVAALAALTLFLERLQNRHKLIILFSLAIIHFPYSHQIPYYSPKWP